MKKEVLIKTARKLLLPDRMKRVLSCAHVCSLWQRPTIARNVQDQNEHTMNQYVMIIKQNFHFVHCSEQANQPLLGFLTLKNF